MTRDVRLLFGPMAAGLLALGVLVLGAMVPGYSQVRQTVSEIGEVGSPVQLHFTILLCTVAACLMVFAAGLRAVSVKAGRSSWPAYVIGCMAISAAGVGFFSFPHPLHNVFGPSELIGYQAPLVLALAWRKDRRVAGLVRASWIWFGLVAFCVGLNLTALDRHGAVWAAVQPVYGIAQRSLFAAWFGWCATVGVMLWRPSQSDLG